ncbi:hypothetical protein LAWI1_G006829 [Lachnellula willkommii]|uniref:Homeobox domain-containing protein n=1 Tax=Lachnellula willkommii TaxID=215461 RepID=A0A559MCP6_9HELO|nr:hypothetical protein LAWI1_G006829 [Lachnellula willkommii]
MEYLDPVYHQQFSHHHEHMPQQGMSAYTEAQHNMHNYAMAQQSASMTAMPPTAKTNETKPRLGKDEVDILEREFKKNPKPTTQTKRQFAEDMGVDLARINNWFQNRRAKRKQEKKQEAYEAGQAQEALGYSDGASSPDFNYGNAYFNDNSMLPQSSAPFPVVTGPPPPVAPFNPQYSDPSSASMESLQRTMAAAQAATQQHEFHGSFSEQSDSMVAFGGSMIQDSSSSDRAQFPPPNSSMAHFEDNQYSFPSTFTNNIYNSPQPAVELQSSPEETATQTPTAFIDYSCSGSDLNGSQTVTTFPSQLLGQTHGGLPSQSSDITDSQSPEESNGGSLAHAFKYDIAESDESSNSPPSPSFKSPPPPTNIASRRKNAVRPAALISETLQNRPSMGPRTVSHAEGFRRPIESPMSSPMRRIVSAGGNRNVLTGRIYKTGIESAQRSPINLGGFSDAGAFMEHNYHTIRNPPSLSALSSLNSSLAPPTPMSPREREMTLVKRETSRSTASPHEGSMNYVFNQGVPGCFTSIEGDDQNLASPPETPQAQMTMQSRNGWANGTEFQEKQWSYEVPDEPLFTPAQGVFPLELQMPQPQYLSNMSQPVTPAFGQQFNPSFMFENESPRFKNESPQYTLSSQSHSEYLFPDGQNHYSMGLLTSPLTKQKTFQFSNTTPADFSEK